MSNRNRYLAFGLIMRGLFTALFFALLLFLPAGTIDFFEAWMFIAVWLLTVLGFTVWLLIRQPNQIANRLNPQETMRSQRILLYLIGVLLCAALILFGFSKRYDWKQIHEIRLIIASALYVGALFIYRNVFSVNPFLSNTVKIHSQHIIIDQGMYGVVRHPMYLATIMTCASGLLIFGYWISAPIFFLFVVMIYIRIIGEEKQLIKALPAEYTEYKSKVPYRLIPRVF